MPRRVIWYATSSITGEAMNEPRLTLMDPDAHRRISVRRSTECAQFYDPWRGGGMASEWCQCRTPISIPFPLLNRQLKEKCCAPISRFRTGIRSRGLRSLSLLLLFSVSAAAAIIEKKIYWTTDICIHNLYQLNLFIQHALAQKETT